MTADESAFRDHMKWTMEGEIARLIAGLADVLEHREDIQTKEQVVACLRNGSLELQGRFQ